MAPNLYLRSDPRRSVGTSAFDPSALVLPSAVGFQQPWPRNYLRNPGTQNWDMSIFKNIRFSESNSSRYLQLRLEGFNVWNHVNYSGYKLGSNTVVPTATGGYSTDTKTIMTNYSAPSQSTHASCVQPAAPASRATASVKRTRKTPETEDPAQCS